MSLKFQVSNSRETIFSCGNKKKNPYERVISVDLTEINEISHI